MNKRLFIVANRLPVCVTGEQGNMKIRTSSGGLVSAINSYLQNSVNDFSEVFWTGVPGCSPDVWEEASSHIQTSAYTYLPVLPEKDRYDKYYNGFSNSVLWPLFHYFPSYAEYDMEEYAQYLLVNRQFAQVLLRHCRDGDTVWIHDYHLLPLAGILREKMPRLTIGFFLHIPFPSFELFRLLPRTWQEQLLKGMLGANLVGFHTADYAAHFLESIQKVWGLEADKDNIIRMEERSVKVDVFPISIDYKCFNDAYDEEKAADLRRSLVWKMNGRRIIFSVDRLDYTKGVQNRLRAYEYFLQQNPQYHNKVVFVIVVVPSRDSIPRYAERKRNIDETISRINSHIGNLHWQPVIYQYNTLEFHEMIALYTGCDLALITPLRDGMNLVAKEFVASRKDRRGVLVISEMAGAVHELKGALSINPNDTIEMAQKIKQALEMPEKEQEQRMRSMQRRIKNYDVRTWAEEFISELRRDRLTDKRQPITGINVL